MRDEKFLRLHGFVSGRVQGVGFRYFTQQIAGELELTGWVKNTFDGKVEFLVEGAEDKLATFKSRISRGPNAGYVSDIKVTDMPATGEFHSFHIRF